MKWDIEIKVEIVKLYFGQCKGYNKVIEELKTRHPEWTRFPVKSTIHKIIKNFEKSGFRPKKINRRQTKMTASVKEQILAEINADQFQSLKKLALKVGVGQTSVHNFLRKEMKFTPYKLRKAQRLYRK